MERLFFSSDYMEGAHPNIMKRLTETNLESTPGYGTDAYTSAAADRIRRAIACPEAEVRFLVGGTQTNATVIDGILCSYQGVIAADTGHIQGHEAGAVEHTGHKVLTLPHQNGKISAAQIRERLEAYEKDDNRDHTVMPGLVYLSHPTEYGTLYSKRELTEISETCHEYGVPLFLDGARLAYALATPSSDVTLPDLARLCDAFYIGGTKCGALFGEAVVLPRPGFIPHFFTIIKQNGALLAKGRLLGLQFDELFRDGLYLHIGKNAIDYADRIRAALREKGYTLYYENPTNQVFTILENRKMKELAEKVEFGFWENIDENHTAVRFATGWATTEESVESLIALL